MTAPAPWPDGLRVVLDRDVRRLAGGTVLLGAGRLLSFRPGVVERLLAGEPLALQSVARRAVEAGLAHPVPTRSRPAGVTVVVPVRDRADELTRCLHALTGTSVVVVDDGSMDPAAVARAAAEHGARLVRQDNTGPAGARNTGLEHVRTPLVAFVDSDVEVPQGWIDALLGHFDDPAVVAVAPRVCAARGPGLLHAYAAARGPLDLGSHPARVAPGQRVSYVPSAALLVRRDLTGILGAAGAFDPALRYGEDVDLLWRLIDAGGQVRYDPRVVARHHEPPTWGAWLTRRFRYGTSAAPLAQRHGARLAPLVVNRWLLPAWLLLATGHPVPAAAAALVPAHRLHRTLRRAGVGPIEAATTALLRVAQGLRHTAAGVGGPGLVTTGPALVLALAVRRTRLMAAVLLLVPPLLEHRERRPAIDPVRWTALRLVDDLAYALGVWKGCCDARTTVPLRPRVA